VEFLLENEQEREVLRQPQQRQTLNLSSFSTY
jgi:hypothetical protein